MLSARALSAVRDGRLTIGLLTIALTLAVALMAMTGMFRSAESRLEALSFSLAGSAASGQVHIVEMDAASMAAIQRWPWPRDHYARAVAALDAAGVRSISFDVDMSSAGDPAGDAALGAAIAAARAPVALPTFDQKAGFSDARQLDALPIPVLREQAHLASVSVKPDPDGFVRSLPLGTVTAGMPRPSLAAFVAGQSGAVGHHFPIDFGIRPDTIPRHSFIAIERGAIPPGSLAGKDVIIGATAIELGDRYPVPHYGMVHGVLIQAIAAETLARGVPVHGSWELPLLLAVLCAVALLIAPQRHVVMLRAGTALAVLLAGWLAARLAAGLWFEIVPALVLLCAAAAIRHVTLSQRAAEQRRRIDAESGLPNRLALEARATDPADRFLIAAQIDDFDALKLAVESEWLGTLLRRIAERLQVASGADAVYRTEERTLVWSSPLGVDEIEAQLAGLRALMRSPFDLGGRRLGVTLTFGVADQRAPDAAAQAVHAASLAKRSGKFWRFNDAGAGETASQQFSLLGELEGALASGAIVVRYQPKLNLATGVVDAAEALVRWNHPERGLVPPDCFIPLFEEAQRIDDLTLAVLAQTLADMRAWRAQGLRIGVAVNISAALLTSDSFAPTPTRPSPRCNPSARAASAFRWTITAPGSRRSTISSCCRFRS